MCLLDTLHSFPLSANHIEYKADISRALSRQAGDALKTPSFWTPFNNSFLSSHLIQRQFEEETAMLFILARAKHANIFSTNSLLVVLVLHHFKRMVPTLVSGCPKNERCVIAPVWLSNASKKGR